ncbi:MAG: hypothetical protein JO211_05090, partial [Acidobacteriaceae bacterium]|nr:hypothetical protein [Acidobacteriaceae bacterium]
NREVIEIWERGERLHPLDRALLVLAAAYPEMPANAVADWPLGRRNSALAELRSAMFSPLLNAWIGCPQCEEKLEFQIDTQNLIAQDDAVDNRLVLLNGRTFRLPTSRDLAVAIRESDPADAPFRLLQNCYLGEDQDRVWSDLDLEEVGESMAAADPLAETRLAFSCPNCGHNWDETFDLLQFMWTEIDAAAKQTLRDVHTLASAYGWTEREILGLSWPRRAWYLSMVEQ